MTGTQRLDALAKGVNDLPECITEADLRGWLGYLRRRAIDERTTALALAERYAQEWQQVLDIPGLSRLATGWARYWRDVNKKAIERLN